ncbi:MAG TPA: hypothetical protein DD723_09115 [Candidatus Omnitrophica bacterium]|nr:MAG: hypothetical protein A2Z81_08715 [Omnitrophica WOR_2 bacterium GWA2_45_18]OGX19204.1 MAG: hypothetical protein A2Y04_00080 [Omnitrophica WOR_2 bacterium GWC2_45_7]HBR15676.1 hypothetical protein [Candidatus Omnitrophota bacterium]
MKTTIVNLRYKMKEILKALDRREQVQILYHGKLKGVISPAGTSRQSSVKEHPFFGMSSSSRITVGQQMEALRKGRYDTL